MRRDELGLKILNPSLPHLALWYGAKISPQHFYGEGKIYVERSGERWVKQDGAKLSSLTTGYYREESYGSGLKTLVKGFKSKIS